MILFGSCRTGSQNGTPVALRKLTEVACAAALLVAALACLLPEMRAAMTNNAPGLGFAAAQLSPGITLTSRQNALFQCDRAMTQPGFDLLGDLSRQAIAGACQDLSRRVLRDAPSHGFAHLIAASAASASGASLQMTDHLAASQSFAPYEGWLAERRFMLIGQADPDVQALLLPTEVSVLMTSQAGAERLVGALASAQRDMILSQAQRATPVNRQRFVNIARRRVGSS